MAVTAVAGEIKPEERIPMYDREKLEEVLGQIEGMEVKMETQEKDRSEDKIQPYASVGETVNSSVLKKGIGSIEMIRYTDCLLYTSRCV